tara:strand:+ start:4633 stop:5109 length:477 start_codon:yes stop_codon:yes gene_type:complete
MKNRQMKRVAPSRPHYISTTTQDLGELSWRIPSPAMGSLLVQFISSNGLIDRAEEGKEGLEELGADLFGLYSLHGATLGLCWYHSTKDLETVLKSHDLEGVKAFGQGVYEEIYEEGWSNAEILTLWGQLFPKIVDSLVDQQKGVEKANFSKPPKAKGG